MNTSDEPDFVAAERERIQLEYQRRAREVSSDLYAPWQPSAQFMIEGRNRAAAMILHRLGVFPKPGDQCLEVGFGALGWLSELIGWGVRESDLHGVELDPSRARRACEILPAADLRTGDAVKLPWNDGTFQLVITSTLFTRFWMRRYAGWWPMKSKGCWLRAERCSGTTLLTTIPVTRMWGESAGQKSNDSFQHCEAKSEKSLWLRL